MSLRCVRAARACARRPLAARFLCTSGPQPSEPLLPKWGSFGKSHDDVSKLMETVRDDGDRQAAVTKQLAEMALRFQAMLTRPAQWFKCAHVAPRPFFLAPSL